MKCSLCGGNLELSPDMSAGICTSCHAIIPLPKIRPALPVRETPEEEPDLPLPPPTAVPAEGASVSTLLRQGYEALALRDWRGAAAMFRGALEQDGDCAEAHFGRALARQSSESVDALIRKRQRGGTLVRKTWVACEEDRGRISAAERKYSVPGYYTPRQIRMLFEGFDRTYLSVTDAWRDRLREEYQFWDTDRALTEALRCAKGDLALTIRSARDQVLDELRRELELSESRDRDRIQKTIIAYDAHLDRAEREAALRSKSAQRTREKDYEEACEVQEKSETEEELLDAAGRFSALGAYLDSQERAKRCREKLRRIVEEEKNRALERELLEQRQEEERREKERLARRKRRLRLALFLLLGVLLLSLAGAALVLFRGGAPAALRETVEQALRGISEG